MVTKVGTNHSPFAAERIFLWTLCFTQLDAVALNQHSQSIKGWCGKDSLGTKTGGPHTAIA